MGSSRDEVAVFVETNLGTRFVVPVSPYTALKDFKSELEMAHLKCFPSSGEIRICGLMVKLKSIFYHLPESMLIKHAFQGKKGTWFLHMEAEPLSEVNRVHQSCNSDGRICLGKSCFSESVAAAAEIWQSDYNGNNVSNTHDPESELLIASKEQNKREGKEKKIQREKSPSKHLSIEEERGHTADEKCGCSASKVDSEMSSEVISVTGIIKRYFPYGSRDGVSNVSPPCSDTAASKSKTENSCPSNKKVPLLYEPSEKTSTCKLLRLEVGKRLVTASSSLGMAGTSKKKFLTSLHSVKDGKVRGIKSFSLDGDVYDISDDESDGD